MDSQTDQVTAMIQAVIDGDADQGDQVALVLEELHRLADMAMRRERADHTLQATALVNEAYMRLAGQKGVAIRDRGHFYALAATVMRRILVDYARGRNAHRRGGALVRVSLSHAAEVSETPDLELLALDEQLTLLARLDRRQAQLLEMRFFAGLSIEEISEASGLAPSTVHKQLKHARAWLFTRLRASHP